jgi:hypothetical protein
MEVDFKLYFWLCKLGVFEDSNPHDEQVKMLPRDLAQKFESGFIVAKILDTLKKKVRPSENAATNFNFVKDSYDEEEIRQNWNFILAVLDQGFGIRLDGKTRELVMETDRGMICELVNIIYEKYG